MINFLYSVNINNALFIHSVFTFRCSFDRGGRSGEGRVLVTKKARHHFKTKYSQIVFNNINFRSDK